MGTTGSTPAPTAVERKHPTTTTAAKAGKKNVPAPPIKHQHSASSSPAPKKGPKNYVDMGIEEEGAPEQGEELM